MNTPKPDNLILSWGDVIDKYSYDSWGRELLHDAHKKSDESSRPHLKELRRQWATSSLDSEGFWAQIEEHYEIDSNAREQLKQTLLTIRPNNSVIEWIRQHGGKLEDGKKAISIFSNTPAERRWAIAQFIAQEKLGKQIDKIFFSCDMGLNPRDIEFWRTIRAGYENFEGGRTWVVHTRSDTQSQAQAAGFTAYLYETFPRFAQIVS
jgi:hypothetical protein